MLNKTNILGVGITNATIHEVLEYITKSLEDYKKKYFIVTPNPEFLVLANKNPYFKNILNRNLFGVRIHTRRSMSDYSAGSGDY